MIKKLSLVSIVFPLVLILISCDSSHNLKERRAHYNATNIVTINNNALLLNYDYVAILQDFKKFLNEFMHVKNATLIFDPTDEKANLYKELALYVKFRAYLSYEYQEHNDYDNLIEVSFKDNKNQSEVLVTMRNANFTIQRLYQRDRHDTYAISNFSLLEA